MSLLSSGKPSRIVSCNCCMVGSLVVCSLTLSHVTDSSDDIVGMAPTVRCSSCAATSWLKSPALPMLHTAWFHRIPAGNNEYLAACASSGRSILLGLVSPEAYLDRLSAVKDRNGSGLSFRL